MEQRLREAWHHLQQRLDLAVDKKERTQRPEVVWEVVEQVEERWWQVLVQHYGFGETGPGASRPYHCFTHVNALLDLCLAYESALKRRNLVELAIFFHEYLRYKCSVVYDAKAKDNEEQSALMFEQYADEVGLSAEAKTTVAKWIIDTKTHTTADIHGDEDEAYFLDFDLAVLGEDEDQYDTYARHIRTEYAHYPDEAYRSGRHVLESFLLVPSLFRTQAFKEAREAKARSNIRREIDRLRGGG